VIEPRYLQGVADERLVLEDALDHPTGSAPLSALADRGKRVAVAVCDVTRPIPTDRILPPILERLRDVPRENISILVATGTHRPSSRAEMAAMLGESVLREFQVINHDCRDGDNLVFVGKSKSGIPIWLNRRWLEADLRITTGFVEPHFFAGFSGGPKLVAPGLAGLETIMHLHNAELIGDPNSTWGVTKENPIHTEIREISRLTGVTFSLDVTINCDRKITGVFAGELFAEHEKACALTRETTMQPVAEPFDVVVTTNSGYPLDLNLYQSVKGMSAAARVVKEGGAIVCAAECSDGIPGDGEYAEILASAQDPRSLLELINQPGYCRQDQWEAQIQAMVQLKARVYLKSDFLSPGEIRAAHLEPSDDVAETVQDELENSGSGGRVCVLPEGPQTIPYLHSG
jgi:nickel-dependent lactate racemase